MEVNKDVTVYSHISIPLGFSIDLNQKPKTSIYTSLQCSTEPYRLKQMIEVQGASVMSEVETLAVRVKGSVMYVVNVPIFSESNQARGYLASSDTTYINQVVSLADLDFQLVNNHVMPTISSEIEHIKDGLVVVRSTCTFPVYSKMSTSPREQVKGSRERLDSLRFLLEKIKHKKSSKKDESRELVPANVSTNLGGRPKKMNEEKILKAKRLMADSQNTVLQICETLNISKSTLYRYLKKT